MPEVTSNVVASRAIHGRRSRSRTRATGAEDVRANKESSSLKRVTSSDETPSDSEAGNNNPFNDLPHNGPAPNAQNVRYDAPQAAFTFQADNLRTKKTPSDIVEIETPFPALSNLPVDLLLSPAVIAFICSTYPQPKLKAATAVDLRHRKNTPNPSRSTTTYESSATDTSRHRHPPEPLVIESANLPDIALQGLESDLSPRHRGAMEPFLPKKHLVESDCDPCARPIHPAVSNFFLPSTDSPLCPESPLQDNIPPGSPSLASTTLQTTSIVPSPPLQKVHTASTNPEGPVLHERAITPSPPTRGSLNSQLTTSEDGAHTDHQLNLHHFSSYDPLGRIIQNTPLGRILALAAEVAASHSATLPPERNRAVDVPPRPRLQETNLYGGDIWIRPRAARTRAPKIGRERSGSWVGVREPETVGVAWARDEGAKDGAEAGWGDEVDGDEGYGSCGAPLEGRERQKERDVEWEDGDGSGGSVGEEKVEGEEDEEGRVDGGGKSGRGRRREEEREEDDWVGFNDGFWRYLLVDGRRSREAGRRSVEDRSRVVTAEGSMGRWAREDEGRGDGSATNFLCSRCEEESGSRESTF